MVANIELLESEFVTHIPARCVGLKTMLPSTAMDIRTALAAPVTLRDEHAIDITTPATLIHRSSVVPTSTYRSVDNRSHLS